MNFKRRHPRRSVRCVLCTDDRFGNSRKGDSRRQVLQRFDWLRDAKRTSGAWARVYADTEGDARTERWLTDPSLGC
jgi:hypothetical protein